MWNSTKKILTAMVLATILLLSSGSFSANTAEAQGWHRGGFGARQRVFVTPRVRVFAFPRAYGYSGFRPYGYYPYGYYPYGYYSYGYAPYSRYDLGPNSDQVGYRDGYDRGQEDARKGRGYDPNNSSHFRNAISATYRDGFRQGYEYGYRRFAG